MKWTHKKAFTLVELLVVITILAIISVVAYQNFGGAVDKALSGRKVTDVTTIGNSLAQYKVENNYYPSVGEYDASTNLWGYASGSIATPSNPIRVTYDGDTVSSVVSSSGGGTVMSGATAQIGAKGTIGKDQLGKYLSTDLYDPELGDIKVGAGTMIDQGIGRYIYAVSRSSFNWPNNQPGTYYNIAFTIKEEGSETYTTKIVGDYSNENFDDPSIYPETLIGNASSDLTTNILTDGMNQNASSSTNNYGVPYAVTDFAQ